jgi:hypothetical protein
MQVSKRSEDLGMRIREETVVVVVEVRVLGYPGRCSTAEGERE